MSYTATKVQHGSKFKVYVFEDGNKVAVLGGNRAARANAVIVSLWPSSREPSFKLRADTVAATKEAARNSVDRKVNGRYYVGSAAVFSYAVLIDRPS
jgi:hypothetical protein